MISTFTTQDLSLDTATASFLTSFDLTSFDLTSFDLTSFDLTSFDLTSFDLTSFDLTSFDLTLSVLEDVDGGEDLALLMASSSIFCAGKRHYRNVYSGCLEYTFTA